MDQETQQQVQKIRNDKIKLPPINTRTPEIEDRDQLLRFTFNQQSPKYDEAHHFQNPLMSKNPEGKSLKSMISFFNIKTFAKKMVSLIKPDSRFTISHLQLIKDQGSNPKQPIQTNQIKRTLIQQNFTLFNQTLQLKIKFRVLKNQFKSYIGQSSLIQRIPLVDPVGYPKFFWDVICTIIRLYLIIFVPIIISFYDVSFDLHIILLIISCIVLIFDILMRCFTITYEQGQPVNDKMQLIQNQMNLYTAIEFISFIYTIILAGGYSEILDNFVLSDGWPKLFLLFLYMQIVNILNLMEMGQYFLKMSKTITSLIELSKLIGLILLIQHVCGCIWLIIGLNGWRNGEQGWMVQIPEYDLASRYLESFYFISVTMFTVGYGDTLPIGKNEKLFIIAYMFLCTLQLSYSVNTIGTLLTQLKETNETIRQKLTIVNEYMDKKRISANLQYQVREYFNYYLQQERIQQTNEQTEIIKLLPEDLQNNLKKESALILMNKCSFFRDNLSEETKEELAEQIDFQTYQPGVTINTKTEFNIYIVESGSVDIYQGKVKLGTIKPYKYFGVSEFVSKQQSQLTYKTSQFTSILIIPFNKFYEIIKLNQADFENFCLCQETNRYNKNCFICTTHRHMTNSCSLVHFSPNQELVIKRYLYIQVQDRNTKFDRQMKKKRQRTIKQTQQIQESFKNQKQEIIQELYPDIDELVQEQEDQVVNEGQDLNNEHEDIINLKQSKVNQAVSKFLKQKPQIQRIQKEKKFEDIILENLTIKYGQLSKFRKKCQEELHYQYLLQVNSKLQQQKDFEKIKQYEIYHPDWNIDHIIPKVQNQIIQQYPQQYLAFKKYMLSPWDYINLYQKNKDLLVRKSTKNKTKKKVQMKKRGSVYPSDYY